MFAAVLALDTLGFLAAKRAQEQQAMLAARQAGLSEQEAKQMIRNANARFAHALSTARSRGGCPAPQQKEDHTAGYVGAFLFGSLF